MARQWIQHVTHLTAANFSLTHHSYDLVHRNPDCFHSPSPHNLIPWPREILLEALQLISIPLEIFQAELGQVAVLVSGLFHLVLDAGLRHCSSQNPQRLQERLQERWSQEFDRKLETQHL